MVTAACNLSGDFVPANSLEFAENEGESMQNQNRFCHKHSIYIDAAICPDSVPKMQDKAVQADLHYSWSSAIDQHQVDSEVIYDDEE